MNMWWFSSAPSSNKADSDDKANRFIGFYASSIQEIHTCPAGYNTIDYKNYIGDGMLVKVWEI